MNEAIQVKVVAFTTKDRNENERESRKCTKQQKMDFNTANFNALNWWKEHKTERGLK